VLPRYGRALRKKGCDSFGGGKVVYSGESWAEPVAIGGARVDLDIQGESEALNLRPPQYPSANEKRNFRTEPTRPSTGPVHDMRST
jgi:hypothetical protein